MLMQGWLTVIIVYLLSLLSCAFCILFSPHLMNIKSVRYLQHFVPVYLRMRVLTGILVCVRLHESPRIGTLPMNAGAMCLSSQIKLLYVVIVIYSWLLMCVPVPFQSDLISVIESWGHQV